MTASTSDTPAGSSDLNAAALQAWMREHVAGFSGAIRITRFQGGQSNPTYQLQTPTQNYVLRRQPFGELLKGAHAVDREARVMTALGQAGFPVPQVYGVCTDNRVIGSWFYVMEMVQGRIFWNSSFADVPREERRHYMDAMNATLAQLHGVDYQAIGLGDYGKPGGYVARQVARWSKQYLDDTLAGRHPAMDKLVQWLGENVPPDDRVSITHGDFRVDNMVFHPTQARVIAVLDWELSTLGDTLADFAYHVMMFRMPPDIVGGLAGLDLQEAGLPTEQEYVDAYCRRTGRDRIDNLNFYIVFNMFRFAAILHGVKGRALRGNASNAHAEELANRFTRVADIAWQYVRA